MQLQSALVFKNEGESFGWEGLWYLEAPEATLRRYIAMKSKRIGFIFLLLAVAALSAGLGAYSASNYGTSADPLITKSYLDKVLTPELSEKFENELAEALFGIENPDTFMVVTLARGEVLTGSAGCEVLLRSGSAGAASGNVEAIADFTDATTVARGESITRNHLYMIMEDGDGIVAQANEAVLLVRGNYRIS